MITAVFKNGERTATAKGLVKYDYGQVLRVKGLNLPKTAAVQFATNRMSEAIPVIAETIDGVTDVMIPNSLLRNDMEPWGYNLYAYIYVLTGSSGKTEYIVTMPVEYRPRTGQDHPDEETANAFDEVVAAVNSAAARAEEAASNAQNAAEQNKVYNALAYGVSAANTGLKNSQALQTLIDTVATNGGGTVYISAGTYIFASNGSQTIGNHCIKMKSNVNIKGDGSSTILLPSGTTEKGLDMFYFNEFVDAGNKTYLENCTFSDFVIDGKDSSCTTYTSAGKGFMINLLRNCVFRNIIVRNTDATGIGPDCPIDCCIVDCIAENCGKAATVNDNGASGIGIGFGMSAEESMYISRCRASGNRKYGIFFEHQKVFEVTPTNYTATNNRGLFISDCMAEENYCNFGAVSGINAYYKDCFSRNAVRHGYYLDNSNNCVIESCSSASESDASFGIFASDTSDAKLKTNCLISCVSRNTQYGCKISASNAVMDAAVKDCFFDHAQTNSILTAGAMRSLILEGNVANGAENNFGAEVTELFDKGNSWNTGSDIVVDKELSETSENPIQNQAVTKAIGSLTEEITYGFKYEDVQEAVNNYLNENPVQVSGISASVDADGVLLLTGSSVSISDDGIIAL